MKNNKKKYIFDYNNINKKSKIVDCVAVPILTPLIDYCIKNNIININGLELAYHQAVRQFKLYTNYNVPKNYKIEFMKFFSKPN
jgi:shikimate 5-dehydrogenase